MTEIVEDTWIQTHTGKVFKYNNITEDMICIEDIAHALSNICRFNGHSKTFYSVAEHCLHMSKYVLNKWGDKKKALAALLHDATEAYFCDLPRPIKYNMPVYRGLEMALEKMIFTKYGLEYPMPDWLKELDYRMLATEKDQVMEHTNLSWGCDGVEKLPITLFFDDPAAVKWDYMSFFKFLNEDYNI